MTSGNNAGSLGLGFSSRGRERRCRNEKEGGRRGGPEGARGVRTGEGPWEGRGLRLGRPPLGQTHKDPESKAWIFPPSGGDGVF